MPPDDGNQDRAIGRIEGKLDLLIAEQQEARAARKQTYERLENLARTQDETDRTVKGIDKRLEAVEEPVAEFSVWRERVIGAAMAVSFAAALVGGAIATIGKKLWEAVVGP